MKSLEKATAIVEALNANSYKANHIRKEADGGGYWITVVVKEGRKLYQYRFFIADSAGEVKFLGADKISGKQEPRRYSSSCQPIINILTHLVGDEIWNAPVGEIEEKAAKHVEEFAIIEAVNPYRSSDVYYGWVRNEDIDIDSKTFRKMAKRAADRLAERHFREHCGGSVIKVYKDVDKFKAHYLKLTGNNPAID